jgi:hypothetical protein
MADAKLVRIVRFSLVIILTFEFAACNAGTPKPVPQRTQTTEAPTSVPPPTVAPSAAPTTDAPQSTETTTPASEATRALATTVYEPLPAQCGWGQVVVAGRATINRAQPGLEPGGLFSSGGSFAAKPADEPCDPGQELGPFPVSAGGSLVARLTGNPPAPNQWSLGNNGTSMRIVFEPLLGEDNYGPGQEVLAFAIPAEETEAEMGGSWPGPGRLRAYIGAPHGSGPLTGSCFEQSYSAEAEIVEVFEASPAGPGMTLHHGDSIITEETWGEVLIAGSKLWVAPGSEIGIDLLAPQIREGTYDLATGERPDYWNDVDYKVAQKLQEFQKAGYLLPANTELVDYDTETLAYAFERISGIQDPCAAALDLKLYLDAQPQGFHKKAADLLVDVAAIWLLPNNWDVLDGWGKMAFGQLPGIGYVSQAQNALDTWNRVKKEWIPTVSEQKAGWTLAGYERYKQEGWSEAQIDAQDQSLQQQSEESLAEIKRLRENFDEMVPTLTAAVEAEVAEIKAASDARLAKIDQETQVAFEELQQELAGMPDEDPGPKIEGRKSLKQLREEEFWQNWKGRRATEILGREASVAGVMVPFQLQMQGLANEYEREVTRHLTEIARLQTERDALEAFVRPLARGDCPGIKAPKAAPAPDLCTGQKVIEMGLKKGTVHIIESRFGPAAGTIARTITVNLDKKVFSIKPDGTEYSVEKQDETAIVRVYAGQVSITADSSEGWTALTVVAGQQVTLPEGELSALVPEPVRRVGGLPLSELRLDSDLPEPYGDSELRAADGLLPSDWIWQETSPNLDGPGDATLEVVDAETLRIIVPNENDFWAHRADAPRLLHKASGDFDLEAEMRLQSEGAHFAYSEFVIFAPQTPLGYLQGQMNGDGLGAHYFIAGGGLAQEQNLRKLRVVNRAVADAPDTPDAPVRVRFARRGDQLSTYWSTDGGATWTLSSRQAMPLPETLWVGWLFKRMAYDGLNEEPAVTTLRSIRLTTAPRDSMPEAGWDIVDYEGMVIPLGAELQMTQDGSAQSYVQAYSPWSIAGDFDLIVRFEAPPLELQPEQERYIHVAVTSNDERNHAYVRSATTPDWQRYDADMAINTVWYRFHYEDTQESSGRVRLVRKDGIFSGYVWKEGDWVALADWQEGFSDPVYLDLRYQWKTPTPSLQTVSFIIERLETEDGILIGAVEEPPAASAVDESQQATPIPETPTPLPEPTPGLTGEQRLEENALFDDFSSPALGWSVRDNESATTGYEAGGYAILVKQPTYWVMSKVPGDFAHTVIEFDAAVAPGSAGGMYGVICHYRNSENYDFVAIDPETGSVSAGRLLDGAFQFLTGDPNGTTEQPASSLAPSITASNHIRVGCYDDRLELAIGSTMEGAWSLDPPGIAGSAALFAYGFNVLGQNGYKALFDNLAAWHEESAVATPASPAATAAADCSQVVDPQIAAQWDREALGCPAAPATTTWAAVQPFERGLMIWRGDLWLIYSFYDAGGWATWPDVWSEGLDIPSRGVPPSGLEAPERGLGFVWAVEEQVFQNLGWARWEESGMCAIVQDFEKGMVIRRSEVDACAGQANPGASAWFGSVEAYDNGQWR